MEHLHGVNDRVTREDLCVLRDESFSRERFLGITGSQEKGDDRGAASPATQLDF